jgi:hypothetical protein
MQVKIDKSLRDYIAAGNETTEALLASGSPLIHGIEEFYSFFQKELWATGGQMSPNQALLSMHTVMMYVSAVRMALTGHTAATFPLFRTAFEAACYAYLVGKDNEADQIWSERNSNPEAMKRCRSRFTSAVKDAAKAIQDTQDEPGHDEWIVQCYDEAIDFGAHPNPRSIYSHMRPPMQVEEGVLVELIGLHSEDAHETSRALVACLDFGLAIAIVLTHGVPSPTQDLSDKLFQLHEMKDQIVAELFPGTE